MLRVEEVVVCFAPIASEANHAVGAGTEAMLRRGRQTAIISYRSHGCHVVLWQKGAIHVGG